MEPPRPAEPPFPSEAPPPAPSLPAPPMRKHPGIAFLLAGFPGMGHIYDGLYLRGVVFFTLIASLLAIGSGDNQEHSVLGFVVAFVWIFNIIDSVRQAQLINYGYAQDLGLKDLPAVPKAGQGGLLAGLLFLALGIIAALETYLDLDLTWIVRLWPLALIAAGGWLVAAWFRDRKKAEPEEKGNLL